MPSTGSGRNDDNPDRSAVAHATGAVVPCKALCPLPRTTGPRAVSPTLNPSPLRIACARVRLSTWAPRPENDSRIAGPATPPTPARADHGCLGAFGAGRKRTESHPFSKRANMCADHARTLDACGLATPNRRKRELAPMATILARAQATYRSSFHDAPDPLTVRALARPVLRVVPVSPTPLMAAGQSEPRGLGHAWRLVGRGVELLRTKQMHMAPLPETGPNIALSGRFAC